MKLYYIFKILLLVFILSSCEFAWYKIVEVEKQDKIDIDRKVVNNISNNDWNSIEIIDLSDWDNKKDLTWSWIVQKKDNNTDNIDYCILDICLDREKDIIEKEDIYMNYFDRKESENFSFIKKDGSYIKKIIEMWTWSTTKYISKIGKDYLKQTKVSNCWGITIEQKMYNSRNKVFSDVDSINIFRTFNKWYDFKDFSIWYLNYKLKINFNIKESLISANNVDFIDIKVSWVDEIKEIIEKQIKDDKKIMSKYVFPVKTDTNLYILYDSNIEQPERIIFLWDDKEFLDKNIRKNWDFINLALTNKIIWYYKEDSSKWLTRWDSKRVFSINNKDLPVFNLKKLNNKGNYLLYSKKPYSFQYFVETCKPDMYLYNEKKNN